MRPDVRPVLRTAKLARLAVAVPAYTYVPPRLKPRYAQWMRSEIESAGCIFVKIGQWVSSRTDVFPPAVTEEFARLREGSQPMPPSALLTQLRGMEFDSFESVPVSTGSVAQVHRAVYKGRDVAVKIQRPDLLDNLKGDVAAITRLLGALKVANPKSYDDLVTSLDDLIATVTRELDFPAEAASMRRFRAFFLAQNVVVPEVYHVSANVIVMEFVDSKPFAQKPGTLIESFFLQFFELGWLHTDMHSGNLGETPDGKLVLFDFGSVLEIPDDIRLCIKHLMVSYLNKDVTIMVDYMLEYGLLEGTPDAAEREMLESFVSNVLEYVEITDMARFASVMNTIPVPGTPQTVFRSEVFMIMRSFTLLEGLCKSLDPDFVILEAVAPLTEYFARDPMVFRLKVEDDLRTVLKWLGGSR